MDYEISKSVHRFSIILELNSNESLRAPAPKHRPVDNTKSFPGPPHSLQMSLRVFFAETETLLSVVLGINSGVWAEIERTAY